MRKNLERRLRLAEITGAESGGIQIWIDQGAGTVRDLHGEEMTSEEAETLARVTGMAAIFLSEADARL